MTGLLVRSTATQWAKGSILAVDAGTHLAAIVRILQEHLPYAVSTDSTDQFIPAPNRSGKLRTSRKASSISKSSGSSDGFPYSKSATGFFSPVAEVKSTRAGSPGPQGPNKPKLVLTTGPFVGFILPYETAKANGAYLLRNLISTYLITHPHLDHLSGFAVNTASFQHTSRPKKVAALPSTINAIKSHIFNDVIWPNLSDEEGGVGLVSYMRLVEGGNIALGEGGGRGYIELCDGLSVKAWSVSHGHCMRGHSHRGSSLPPTPQDQQPPSARRSSRPNISPSARGLRRGSLNHIESSNALGQDVCVYDSSAFFIRDEETGREILIFGDVEPDSISLSPRTARVWADAAPKIASGVLSAIFIECSYDDSQRDETLFGHLAPRHLIAELSVLANEVRAAQKVVTDTQPVLTPSDINTSHRQSDTDTIRKRKRASNGLALHEETRRGRTSLPRWRRAEKGATNRSMSPETLAAQSGTTTVHATTSTDSVTEVGDSAVGTMQMSPGTATSASTTQAMENESGTQAEKALLPLQGLMVIIIHVKDSLRDGPPAGEVILGQLLEMEREVGLGCEFQISKSGGEVWV